MKRYLDPRARRPILLIATALAALAICQSPAVGQAFQQFGGFLVDPQSPDTVILDGEIETGDGRAFEQVLATYPRVRFLVLNSPGGVVEDGLEIAEAVFARGVATIVPSWAGCYSACAFIFLGGVERHVAGELGVHQFSSPSRDIVDAQRTVADILDVLNQFDTPQQVISAMLRTEPDDMYVFTRAQIDSLAINRGFADGVTAFEELSAVAGLFPSNAGRPDWDLAPTFGEYRVGRSGLDETVSFPVLSGGPIDASRALGASCAGFIAEPPDFRLFVEPTRGPLVIGVRSSADATLIINDPNTDWICDDDGGLGLNPEIRIGGPSPGQYDIWIGTYDDSETHDAQLLVGPSSLAKASVVLDPNSLDVLEAFQDWTVYRDGDECLLRTVAIATQPASGALESSALSLGVNRYLGVHSVTVAFDYRIDDDFYIWGVVDGGREYAFDPDVNAGILFNPEIEDEITRAMRGGLRMIVGSLTADGVDRLDSFSLLGFTAALNRAIAECG